MKKLLTILLALVMVFTFAACGGDTASNEGGEEEQEQRDAEELGETGGSHDG